MTDGEASLVDRPQDAEGTRDSSPWETQRGASDDG